MVSLCEPRNRKLVRLNFVTEGPEKDDTRPRGQPLGLSDAESMFPTNPRAPGHDLLLT